ncbi:RICIN domain-containing protein [Streptomyces sp. NPDC051183]|uniref:RICIN domain-containing protein n=1 Tax=Streptomyces sp. NPDC051183 TaxID=3155165 RepID=UPI0034242CFD
MRPAGPEAPPRRLPRPRRRRRRRRPRAPPRPLPPPRRSPRRLRLPRRRPLRPPPRHRPAAAARRPLRRRRPGPPRPRPRRCRRRPCRRGGSGSPTRPPGCACRCPTRAPRRRWAWSRSAAAAGTTQFWQLRAEGQGAYSVRNANSGQCLSVDAARKENGVVITQYICGLYPDQYWTLRFDAAYRGWQLVSRNSGRCVSIRAGGGNREQALQWDCTATAELSWRT